jgi:hypothetical protein
MSNVTIYSPGQLEAVDDGANLHREFLAGRSPHTLDAYARDIQAFARFLGEARPEAALSRLVRGTIGEANRLLLMYRAHIQLTARAKPARLGAQDQARETRLDEAESGRARLHGRPNAPRFSIGVGITTVGHVVEGVERLVGAERIPSSVRRPPAHPTGITDPDEPALARGVWLLGRVRR